MTQLSWPWSTVTGLGDGAAELGEDNSRYMLATLFGVQDPAIEGVSKGVLNELEVTGAATPLQVDTGSAICYGLYFNDAAVNLAIVTPALGTTGGRVVLQTNWAGTGGASLEARTRAAIKYSADGNPAIPNLTQTPGVTWEISLATFTITTGGAITLTDDRTFRRSVYMVGTDEMDLNSVDDTIAGDRVPQFYRRQGGSASNWNSPGSNNYTPGAVRIQSGVLPVAFSGGSAYSGTVTFPVAFSDIPNCMVCWNSQGVLGTLQILVFIYQVSASQLVARLENISGVGYSGTLYFNWWAVGPE